MSVSDPVVIVGCGLAGISAALALEPQTCIVLSADKVGQQCSSAWAQGGVAAACGADDNAVLHAEDTIKAGAGLCDEQIVKIASENAQSAIQRLLHYGAPFDRDAVGALSLGLEGAHQRRRIVHAGGDGTGRAIMDVMIKALCEMPSIQLIEGARAIDLHQCDNSIVGLTYLKDGKMVTLPTGRVILASGGAGALWASTTNPLGSWGQGLALAARVGAQLSDLEFMQFHPTAMDLGQDPMPLASEALRGEGAILIDETGTRLMKDFPRQDLEARDVVASAIFLHQQQGHKVYLDARHALGASFASHFPGINAVCRTYGIDPAHDPIPVRPAAHYHMGGITVDAHGQSSVKGLWAVGEVASTGLHGANRLASNSLLEAVVFGKIVGEEAARHDGKPIKQIAVANQMRDDLFDETAIRTMMDNKVGVLRNHDGLSSAIDHLEKHVSTSDKALVALLIATSALRRKESRGSHRRSDYPETNSRAVRSHITLQELFPSETLTMPNKGRGNLIC